MDSEIFFSRKHTVWKKLWNLNIKMKLKHFLWRCLHNALPASETLFKRIGKGSNFCVCCGEKTETIEHLLFFCPTAQECGKLETKRISRLRGGDAKLIVDKAQREWLEYEAENGTTARPTTTEGENGHSQHKWEPPKEGVIRINTDAALSAKMVWTGLGIIARNWRGEIVKAKGIVARRRGEPTIEEALALRSALEMATTAGWTTIEVQSDCKFVVSLINSSNVQDCKIQTILEDIEDLKKNFESCVVLFVPRTANNCSHAMAQFAVKSVRMIEWEGTFPFWLSELARKDMGVLNLIRRQAPRDIGFAAHLEDIRDFSSMFRKCSFDRLSGDLNRLSVRLSELATHMLFDEEFLDLQCLSTLFV
ncbi:uncharacterized protein [Coffea arabica]|uniref:Uncharacterized protein n=1 Tax=Coffea arabica TaxID=13443 RepID=A0ABM4WP64_COFAR